MHSLVQLQETKGAEKANDACDTSASSKISVQHVRQACTLQQAEADIWHELCTCSHNNDVCRGSVHRTACCSLWTVQLLVFGAKLLCPAQLGLSQHCNSAISSGRTPASLLTHSHRHRSVRELDHTHAGSKVSCSV